MKIEKIQINAHVRYWEDASVNGIDDIDGKLIPCRNGDNWSPLIDVKTGQILNWLIGVSADIHYKVCDECSWDLISPKGKIKVSVQDEYVPNTLSPADSGYGDYIIMKIDVNGFIQDWDFILEEFMPNYEED